MFSIWVLSIYIATVSALILSKGQNHTLQLSSYGNPTSKEYGVLAFEKGSWVFDPILQDPNDLEDQLYCIGIDTVPESTCVNYKKITPNQDLVIYVDQSGDVRDLSLLKSKRKTGVKVVVKEYLKGAVPKVNSKKVEILEDGSTTIKKEATEEDNRSFIQKYWMYIVPPLVIIMLMGESSTS